MRRARFIWPSGAATPLIAAAVAWQRPKRPRFRAGQASKRDLEAGLQQAGIAVNVIGGAFEGGELDAKRAIAQGTELALGL